MKTILSLLIVALGTSVQAQEEDYFSYDQIVRELSSAGNTTRTKTKTITADPFADILIHGGVSFVNSYLSISPENNTKTETGFHSGIEANIGIDLFSKTWRAEGTVRSFGAERFNDGEVSLKEFDLKLVYEDLWARGFYYRVGGGMAARYLKHTVSVSDEFNTSALSGQTKTKEYTTPASIFFVGVGGRINSHISLGLEMAYRGAMISETIDKSAMDAGIRLDAHF